MKSMDIIGISAIAIPASLAIASLTREFSSGDRVTVGTRFLLPHKVPLDKHLCILGPTRGGKSSLVRAMIRKLQRKYVVTVLDWHGEYAGLLPTLPTSAINMDLEKIPPKLLTEILGFGLGLNEPSMYMLYRMIRDGNYTSFNDLISKIDNYLVSTRTEAEMKAAILRRLEYSVMNIGKGIISVESLMEGDAIIDLSDLTIIEEKRLVSSLILAALYTHYMRRGLIEKGVRHVLIIEEAQNLLDMEGPSYSIIDHIIMELAKYGLRTILVSNAVPKSSILKHCNMVLFKMNPELMEEGVSFSRDLINKLREMTTEEAIVITSKGITKVRPLRAIVESSHVIIRRFNDLRNTNFQETISSVGNNGSSERLSSKVGDDNETINTTISTKVKARERVGGKDGNNDKMLMKQVNPNNETMPINGLLVGNGSNDESLFRKQIMELEREVTNLRDKINEIERILEVDEKVIEKKY
ncbi:ATP-binding protein [Vulcanisaeta sp. JCM 14467]|uniref:ATP-binding protein n=1 Tax=Vulcanisaeta sp. JCM 14467 TaxID=1295370 RepID=UPI000ACE1CEF|nr:DUF87 domain-containing protein [Vulcanisaeta sp. JCM 14467]